MPYKSLAQERYFNANRAKLERQGVNVDEWNQATKGKKLPARKGKKVENVNQHKQMAMTGKVPSGQSFGVKKLSSTHKPHDEPKLGKSKHMDDDERGIPKHRGYHPEPDHGPYK